MLRWNKAPRWLVQSHMTSYKQSNYIFLAECSYALLKFGTDINSRKLNDDELLYFYFFFKWTRTNVWIKRIIKNWISRPKKFKVRGRSKKTFPKKSSVNFLFPAKKFFNKVLAIDQSQIFNFILADFKALPAYSKTFETFDT